MKRAPLEEVEVLIQRLGNQIEPQLPKGWGFFLHCFTVGPEGFCTYITNTRPEDVVAIMAEWLERVRSGGFVQNDTEADCWCCGAKRELLKFEGQKRQVLICADCAGTVSRNGR